jgi:hypothetical protein
MKPKKRSQHTLARETYAINWLAANAPATVRGVCYQLFVAGHIKNMSKSQTNGVSKMLVELREIGEIPWDWIVDETREIEGQPSWRDPKQRIKQAVANYRRDNWADQDNRVQLWAEKGTMRGVVAPILEKWGIDFLVAHGYNSATAMNSAAEYSNASSKPLTILYIGDWDPSGMHMSEVDVPTRFARYGGDAEIRRIALTYDDTKLGLPSFSALDKAKDRRQPWFVDRYGMRCWELDAMNPNDLRNRVDSEVEKLVNMDVWNKSLKIEEAEIASMEHYFKNWVLPVAK